MAHQKKNSETLETPQSRYSFETKKQISPNIAPPIWAPRGQCWAKHMKQIELLS